MKKIFIISLLIGMMGVMAFSGCEKDHHISRYKVKQIAWGYPLWEKLEDYKVYVINSTDEYYGLLGTGDIVGEWGQILLSKERKDELVSEVDFNKSSLLILIYEDTYGIEPAYCLYKKKGSYVLDVTVNNYGENSIGPYCSFLTVTPKVSSSKNITIKNNVIRWQ
ncbi:MAG: hypothetical protein IKO34_07395 [Bacteroidales bacterium]|nr:hypothetical protein [Bacteroidales bacterium]